MKTILRIAIILIFAAIITGITLAIVDASEASASSEPTGEGSGDRYEEGGELPVGELPGGEVPRRGMGSGRHNATLEGEFAGIETVRNFVIVSLLVAILALIEYFLRKNRKRRQQVTQPLTGSGKMG